MPVSANHIQGQIKSTKILPQLQSKCMYTNRGDGIMANVTAGSNLKVKFDGAKAGKWGDDNVAMTWHWLARDEMYHFHTWMGQKSWCIILPLPVYIVNTLPCCSVWVVVCFSPSALDLLWCIHIVRILTGGAHCLCRSHITPTVKSWTWKPINFIVFKFSTHPKNLVLSHPVISAVITSSYKLSCLSPCCFYGQNDQCLELNSDGYFTSPIRINTLFWPLYITPNVRILLSHPVIPFIIASSYLKISLSRACTDQNVIRKRVWILRVRRDGMLVLCSYGALVVFLLSILLISAQMRHAFDPLWWPILQNICVADLDLGDSQQAV